MSQGQKLPGPTVVYSGPRPFSPGPCARTEAALPQARGSPSGFRGPAPAPSPPCPPRPGRRPLVPCTSEPETSRPASGAGHPLRLETAASGTGFLRGLRGAVGTQGRPGRPGRPGRARERRRRPREAWACVTRRLPAARTSCWGHRCCRAEPAVHFTAGTAVTLCLWVGEPVHRDRVLSEQGYLGSKTCSGRRVKPIGSWGALSVATSRAAETF